MPSNIKIAAGVLILQGVAIALLGWTITFATRTGADVPAIANWRIQMYLLGLAHVIAGVGMIKGVSDSNLSWLPFFWGS